MAVSSGQTAAQTQERGPKELHSAGPGRARPGRELCSVRFPLASPRYSRHHDHKSGLFAAPTPPFGLAPFDTRPAPAPPGARCPRAWWLQWRWRKGKGTGREGSGTSGKERAPGSARIFTELCVHLRGGRAVGGAGCLCEALLALWDCKPSQAGKREELTRVGLGTSGFRTAAPGANLVRV